MDERESGLREILNLGHTVGRAIETLSDYKLTHGEAVSIGLAAQARLGLEKGFVTAEEVSRIESLLKRGRLPVGIPDYIDRAALADKLYTDKKVRNGRLRFVFEEGIGKVKSFGGNNYGLEVEKSEIAAVLENM